jgi:hypothetical protein
MMMMRTRISRPCRHCCSRVKLGFGLESSVSVRFGSVTCVYQTLLSPVFHRFSSRDSKSLSRGTKTRKGSPEI